VHRPAVELAAALALVVLAACATPQTDALLGAPDARARAAEVADVPFFEQEAHQCGPAALAMVLAFQGETVAPEALADEVFVPGRAGTLQSGLVGAARAHGRVAYPVRDLDALLAEIAAGRPVIVLQNLGLSWIPVWHYAVAIGYDLDRATLRLHSGPEARRVRPLETFERTWARSGHWALAVLPPSTLPARVETSRWLEAASGLERSGRPDAAEAAYRTALARWPDSADAWLALGNALEARGKLAAAADAYRTATGLAPDSGPAWNNLAHALGALGRRDEAITAIQRAISTGGPHLATYRETLRELERVR
jgi:tetratricopeptide (TPR) repeat protein